MEKSALEETLATVHALLRSEGMVEAAALVRTYPARAEQTGYDNWNGGTEIWEVQFSVPASEYARLGTKRSQLEDQIAARLKTVLESETQNWYSARILPERERRRDWRAEGPGVPRDVRTNILDGMKLEQVCWSGALDDVEFLSRLYDLKELPSHDSRFKDAAGDIWQHRSNNDDWEQDWVFSDERFNLTGGPSDQFLRFLCEVVHPVVRPDRDEALKLVSHFNDPLRQVGWELYEVERIAGRPRFNFRAVTDHGGRAVLRAKNVADALDAGWMAKEIERLENSIDRDPALAIGTAKELIETCCKTILTRQGVEFTKSEDLGELTKKVTKELKLVPEGISDEARGAENIKLVLRNLTQLTNNLAQLRGLYGTGHGRDGNYRGLQPRHARLAVASAVAFIDFVSETYRQRQSAGYK
ncbi:Abortive infection C-terminus [Oryzisolibacter propanilivorax]|uniref:Abortive infection C-terminus n=1 Tax=Oryzisolibacter propanilivorax TaxID=1527607 RepID=A0A1G9QGI7_9BURK|nr:abortive infection family protein [Oryzisolibacter propanilivorax]SDM10214.1 Abortive infection C-terminus [Oryzisolibacter propanilivorax]